MFASWISHAVRADQIAQRLVNSVGAAHEQVPVELTQAAEAFRAHVADTLGWAFVSIEDEDADGPAVEYSSDTP